MYSISESSRLIVTNKSRRKVDRLPHHRCIYNRFYLLSCDQQSHVDPGIHRKSTLSFFEIFVSVMVRQPWQKNTTTVVFWIISDGKPANTKISHILLEYSKIRADVSEY